MTPLDLVQVYYLHLPDYITPQEIIIFLSVWGVMPCSMCTCLQSTKLHDITSQKTIISVITTVRTSCLREIKSCRSGMCLTGFHIVSYKLKLWLVQQSVVNYVFWLSLKLFNDASALEVTKCWTKWKDDYEWRVVIYL